MTVQVRAELPAGEEVGIAVRQSENDHVRLGLARGHHGAWTATVVHRRKGADEALGIVELDLPDGAEVGLRLRARGQDYAFEVVRTAAEGQADALAVAVADGRTLDSVATGGFLGLWVGVYATSEGRATQSQATVGPLTYEPR